MIQRKIDSERQRRQKILLANSAVKGKVTHLQLSLLASAEASIEQSAERVVFQLPIGSTRANLLLGSAS